ncbi:SRPBCC family protein [Cellulomonas iranensis]|uniref:SRPBCC family protein n=1 Tax=Cellulomonas iranensis TaxID=76862 RepID=UPI0023F4A5BD|nr:SRPBCC domain-containing protein [Cellulomonas iranensis]
MLRDSVTVGTRIDASLDVVWRLLTVGRDAWWPEMRFDAVVGSPLVETWTEGGVEATATGRVTRCDAPRLLTFVWAEPTWDGPLEVVIRLTADGTSTVVDLTETGFVRARTPRSLPDEHEQGWGYHLARWKRASEGRDVDGR